MKAKARVIDFLKKTHGRNAPKTYEFTVQGDVAHAHVYIQRMRVELSRMRGIVTDLGKQLRFFKLRVIEITPITENETAIKLLFQEPHSVRVQQDIAQIFGAISIGSATPTDNSTIIEQHDTRSDGVVLPQKQPLSVLLRRSLIPNE